VLGGFQLVLPGGEATFELKATSEHPARQITLKAAPVPSNPFERFIVLMDQIAGILVVVAAAWLVWTRPGAMSWGFFLYVIWFNPGQVYAFYALLQQRPPLLLAQNLASAIAEAAGYVGLILFVLRAPDNEPDRKWRWLERMLPLIGAIMALLMLFTYGNLTGYRTETGTRFSILIGFVVAICAVALLIERTRGNLPRIFSACAGWCGVFDRSPRLSHRRARLQHHDLRNRLGRLHSFGGCHWAALLGERHSLPLCVRGSAAGTCGERVDSASPRHYSRPDTQHPRAAAASRVEYMQQHLAIPNWAWIVDRRRCALSHQPPA